MRDRSMDEAFEATQENVTSYETLMMHRIRNVLLVSSLYDSFTVQQDGHISGALFADYAELNLSYAPPIERVSTEEEAYDLLKEKEFDLAICMPRYGESNPENFYANVKEISPGIEVAFLCYNTRELSLIFKNSNNEMMDNVFVWLGDVRLFVAIIKLIEDRLNVEYDTKTVGTQCIILLEDNVRYYSSFLPMLYTQIVSQTQKLMADGINRTDRMLRMRARHKILLANTFENGKKLFEKYKSYLTGVIVDASFPFDGKQNIQAGLKFIQMVKKITSDRPVLMQSNEPANESLARDLGAQFIDKNSPQLLSDLKKFMRDHMGYGNFIFRMPDGKEIAVAEDLRGFSNAIAAVPLDSLIYHGQRNDFSTWLATRTEFKLASVLKPKKTKEFATKEEFRKYLIEILSGHRDRTRAGVIADFSDTTFEPKSGFVRIGDGSLGGKGRGLAFIHSLLNSYIIKSEDESVRIFVPATCVLATGVFDKFMENQKVIDVAYASSSTDNDVNDVFLNTPLPEYACDSLRIFLQRAKYPLAVRSSSLLEDASFQPFAGIYKTLMIPNNSKDVEVRFKQLENAVKLVFASTFSSDSKSYVSSTPNRLEEEKMAVVIQQIVGKSINGRLYPDMAGVARSFNFYPMEGTNPEDGVVSVVLGLGGQVVDGGKCVRFCPREPARLYQFGTAKSTLASAQREFIALDLNNSEIEINAENEEETLLVYDLSYAEKDGVLSKVGSVYSPDDDAVFDGTSRPGVKIVTMAGVLKSGVFPLAGTITNLLKFGAMGFSRPVEIEFAANIADYGKGEHEFAILQIRPVVANTGLKDIDIGAVHEENAVCIAVKALGNGQILDIRDIVHVSMSTFDRMKTVQIASQIEVFNKRLESESRPYLLIGPGRWGSQDCFLGIGVSWKQISGVKCIVETDMEDIKVEPSQGTHFFQNMTAMGIGYFTVNFDDIGGYLDCDWLDSQIPCDESAYVRLLRFENPLAIAVDGRKQMGVIMKPRYDISVEGKVS